MCTICSHIETSIFLRLKFAILQYFNCIKKRIPLRAEITDAAMAERAECVMLKKEPYISEGITILDNVLKRMEANQSKKHSS